MHQAKVLVPYGLILVIWIIWATTFIDFCVQWKPSLDDFMISITDDDDDYENDTTDDERLSVKKTKMSKDREGGKFYSVLIQLRFIWDLGLANLYLGVFAWESEVGMRNIPKVGAVKTTSWPKRTGLSNRTKINGVI